MSITLYVAAGVLIAAGSLYLAWRYRGVRNFLAGAFFVSSATVFYLYPTTVGVPLLGTTFVQSSHSSGGRAIVLLGLCRQRVPTGFIRKPTN